MKIIHTSDEEAAQIAMSLQLLELRIMDENQLIEQVLDQFIHRHEQTYEEFLNTFTYLSKDHKSSTDSSRDIFSTVVFPHDQPIRNEHLPVGPVAPQPEEEEIVIDEGQKVGISSQGDLHRAGKVKVDNFLDLEDFDRDEETGHKQSPELMLLPGEVEDEAHFSVSSYVPSFDQHSCPEPKTQPAEQPAYRHLKEVSGDEVQPFSLDEEFDYDTVTLTPKFSNAEMKTILEMSSRSRLNPGLEGKEPNI
ncbi:intraflagellar transport-associated protein isoform X2 [Monodelphis domestica]|uniref:intraflagellar transport-associated protein isoform X2 n=1 Tax=Monodelphis domestica TaxID=13616 RepID=UPI0024E22BE4|nr:intraflagellar transport-associated protein isoform X2 [Monodelphis domestica]